MTTTNTARRIPEVIVVHERNRSRSGVPLYVRNNSSSEMFTMVPETKYVETLPETRYEKVLDYENPQLTVQEVVVPDEDPAPDSSHQVSASPRPAPSPTSHHTPDPTQSPTDDVEFNPMKLDEAAIKAETNDATIPAMKRWKQNSASILESNDNDYYQDQVVDDDSRTEGQDGGTSRFDGRPTFDDESVDESADDHPDSEFEENDGDLDSSE